MNQQNLEEIKKIVKEFFKKMTIEVEIEFLPLQENSSVFDGKTAKGDPRLSGREEKIYTLPINLKAEEPQILIGEKGQTLLEIQQLLKIILKRKVKEPFFIDLDIEGYKKKKIEYLKEMVKILADEVALSKKEKWLSPMPSYERRIIHLELAGRKDVVTESIDEGPDRKVIIKPCP